MLVHSTNMIAVAAFVGAEAVYPQRNYRKWPQLGMNGWRIDCFEAESCQKLQLTEVGGMTRGFGFAKLV